MALDRFRPAKAAPDYTYISLAAVLILFGLVMIASSSVVLSVELFHQNYGFVTKQIMSLTIGIAAMIVMSRIDYRLWRQWAPPFLAFILFLVILVFIPGIGKSAKGAARWILIGSFQLQPSELLKLSLILYLAAWFEKRGERIKSFSEGFLPFVVLLAPLIILLIGQRDLGTLIVTLAIAAGMFFISGAPYSHLAIGALTGVMVLILLIAIAPYRLQRIETFLNPSADRLGSGYHINQSLIAVGSGGFWGKGFGKSLQKYLYLPEPHTDSIFAIITEELGFFRALLVLLVIGLFAYRGYQIAFRAGDAFSRMVAFGITSWFLFQSLINIGAILGLIPLTGVPLPFISYGGTSLIVSLMALGIMINISKHNYGK